jgi:hypothetical protein
MSAYTTGSIVVPVYTIALSSSLRPCLLVYNAFVRRNCNFPLPG